MGGVREGVGEVVEEAIGGAGREWGWGGRYEGGLWCGVVWVWVRGWWGREWTGGGRGEYEEGDLELGVGEVVEERRRAVVGPVGGGWRGMYVAIEEYVGCIQMPGGRRGGCIFVVRRGSGYEVRV